MEGKPISSGFVILVTLALTGLPAAASAQAKPWTVRDPLVRPRFATASCNDGTFWTNPQPTGACGGHGGVMEWLRPDPPKDATARCTDLTWSSSNDPRTACVQHGGVRFWVRPHRAANITALCGDGSDWTGADIQAACAGRGGIAEWYGGPGGSLPEKDSPPPRLH